MFKKLYRVWWTPGNPEYYDDEETIGFYTSKEDAERVAGSFYLIEEFTVPWLWGLTKRMWF